MQIINLKLIRKVCLITYVALFLIVISMQISKSIYFASALSNELEYSLVNNNGNWQPTGELGVLVILVIIVMDL